MVVAGVLAAVGAWLAGEMVWQRAENGLQTDRAVAVVMTAGSAILVPVVFSRHSFERIGDAAAEFWGISRPVGQVGVRLSFAVLAALGWIVCVLIATSS
jgi:hypothetical protein